MSDAVPSLFDAVAVHAYWSTAGLTPWNALRWRTLPRPGAPILVTECGRDKVNDGPGGTPLPSATGDNFGWQAQNIDGDAYLRELAAYDAELRRDGVLGVVYTGSPDDEWARKGFSIDGVADRCHGFTNLGPHDLEGRSPQSLAWAAVAPIVKSVDQTAAIRYARPGAITIYRRRFTPSEQDDFLQSGDAGALVARIDAGLAGFRHPNLHVELLNEVGQGRRDQYLALARVAVPLLRARGLRVAGPSWATGDYEAADWAAFAAEERTMADWYPGATRRLITTNYTPGRAGRTPLLIVDHVSDGDGSPYTWFDTDRGEAGSSAHFAILRSGTVEQYRPLGDTCWANGPKCQPDLTNPVIAWLISQGYIGMNSVSVAIEHVGRPGVPLTAAQIAASRALHQWLGAQHTIALDRTHVVGHYQFDRCTRANCPGPTHPWKEILMPDPAPPLVDALRDQTYALAHQLRGLKARWLAAGYPQHAEAVDNSAAAIERLISIGKGEK